jgi:dephospho-CoA kinase
MTRTGSLIFLYGPPGAGKLTVAKALADAYGLRIIDNHVSLDPALRLFEFGSEELFELVTRLRLELIGAGARAGLDVVSTFVYAHPVDREHVDRILGPAEAAGARVTRVQLLPRRAVLEQRVLEQSRHNTTKIGDVALLRGMFDQYDMETPIDASDLSIDNSELAATDAARMIAQAAGLI